MFCFFFFTQTGDPSSTGLTSEGAPEAHLVIWGTDVNVQETKKRFKEFLESFVDDQSEDDIPPSVDADQPYYMARLEEVLFVFGCENVLLLLIFQYNVVSTFYILTAN